MASMNETPASERVHIAFFGCRNAGKSSLLNAVTGQHMAIVSDVKGTTTDPVYKAMELLPAGPVTIIDTPGLDDVGELGQERVRKAKEVLRKTDVAVMAADAAAGLREEDRLILNEIALKNIPYILVFNKIDTAAAKEKIAGLLKSFPDAMAVSAVTGEGIHELKERIAALAKSDAPAKPIAADLVNPGDFVVLVVPIDKAAPKGRLILPQQQVIRDLLDHGMIPVITRDSELEETLKKLGNQAALVITDSQAFKKVDQIVPETIPLTSFSILFSRYKGELNLQLEGASVLDRLEDGDKILIAEGCTHHRQCGDIGTEKIPALIKKYTGKEIRIDFVSGQEYADTLKDYRAVIHCGGCMLNEKEMKARIEMAGEAGVPISNYGMIIAKTTGILDRSMQVFAKGVKGNRP